MPLTQQRQLKHSGGRQGSIKERDILLGETLWGNKVATKLTAEYIYTNIESFSKISIFEDELTKIIVQSENRILYFKGDNTLSDKRLLHILA